MTEMGASLLLVFLLSTGTVRQDGTPLQAGCGASEDSATTLRAGDPVQIRFAFSGEAGTCYKVLVSTAGKELEGYLPASALDTSAFEQARRSGRNLGASREPPSQARQIQQRALELHAGGPLDRAAHLLNSGQPAEALSVIESMLKLDPKNASLLAVAGVAAYQGDDLKTAIHYLKQSLELKSDPMVEQFLRKVENEESADKSSAKIFSTRFVLRYEEAVPADVARQIVATLESEYVRISNELGCRADERIVTVVQSRDAYLRTTQAAEWSGGRYDGRIHIALLDNNRIGPETVRSFGHEIVHACLANLGRWPSWLHEGVAQRLTGEKAGPEISARIRELGRAGNLPKLSAIQDNWGRLGASGARLAYGIALAAVNLFYEHHSAYGIRNLLRNPDSLPQIAEDLDKRLLHY